MIESFHDKRTIALFLGQSVKGLPPANRLEKLSGDSKGQWSIRINDQWRICFDFAAGNAHDVEVVDYH